MIGQFCACITYTPASGEIPSTGGVVQSSIVAIKRSNMIRGKTMMLTARRAFPVLALAAAVSAFFAFDRIAPSPLSCPQGQRLARHAGGEPFCTRMRGTGPFAQLIEQRRAGVPVAQLLGEWGFWTLRSRQPLATELRVYPNLFTERKQLAALFLNRGTPHTQAIIPLLDMPTDFVRAGRLCSADITGGGHLDLVAATATSAGTTTTPITTTATATTSPATTAATSAPKSKSKAKQPPFMAGLNMSAFYLFNNVHFIFYLAFLGIIYIANSHYAVQTIKEIKDIQAELKAISWECNSKQSDLMYQSMESIVAKKVEKLGLRELETNPKKIINKKD